VSPRLPLPPEANQKKGQTAWTEGKHPTDLKPGTIQKQTLKMKGMGKGKHVLQGTVPSKVPKERANCRRENRTSSGGLFRNRAPKGGEAREGHGTLSSGSQAESNPLGKVRRGGKNQAEPLSRNPTPSAGARLGSSDHHDHRNQKGGEWHNKRLEE